MSGLGTDDLIGRILDIASEKDMPVIGIDGLGGAGKSTIAVSVKERLETKGYNAILLHIDDFIFQRSIRYNDAYPQWECYYELQWRYNYFVGVLSLIKSRDEDTIRVDLYDKNTDCFEPEILTVNDKTVIIVEGIFLQREELRSLFDLIVYIDVPEEERLRRVIKRDKYIGSEDDIRQKYEERYFPAERYYTEKFSPKSNADMVIIP